jgi:hypothetical protein
MNSPIREIDDDCFGLEFETGLLSCVWSSRPRGLKPNFVKRAFVAAEAAAHKEDLQHSSRREQQVSTMKPVSDMKSEHS